MLTIRVEFDDGDWLITRFNGTTDEAKDYYLGLRSSVGYLAWPDQQWVERTRTVVAIEFLQGEMHCV